MASGGAAAAAAASSEGSGHKDRCSVLLDVQAYIGANKNASTARSKTSTGHIIEVTFCIVPPPALSHISVHCPDLRLPPDNLGMAPQAVAATDNLIVLRVPVNHMGRYFFQCSDYFVYRAHHQDPKLDLLPNPWPYCFKDQEIAILSCGPVSADGAKQYVVAALRTFPFTLHLYRSKPGGETGSWTVQRVSVEKPLRDSVCPIPHTAQRLLYHLTTSVITPGGANGTVGWVDLWRGILLCDVLEESPKLRDIPLPLPAKGNWRRFLCDGERFVRDITVSQHKDSIKYIEMEIVPPRVVTTTSSPDPATYLEWIHHKECLPPPTQSVVPGRWKATTWSMPIPVTSWDDWHTECAAESQEFHVSNPRHSELLQELMGSSGGDKEAKEAILSLGSLYMGYPAFSIDNDVVYLLCKAARRGPMGLVAAVDVRKKELRGVAKLNIERNSCLIRCYIATEISKYLKTTDDVEDKMSNEERMDNGGLVCGLDSVEEKMYEDTRTGPILDKFSLINSTEKRMDGKTSANPPSHESVDNKIVEQAVNPTSFIGTVGGIGNAKDNGEETAADPRSVENATTRQVTDTENSEQNENSTSTDPASDEAQVPQNTNDVAINSTWATSKNKEMAYKEMASDSDSKRLSLKALLGLETEEKGETKEEKKGREPKSGKPKTRRDEKQGSFRRWYLKTTCR